jgi:site-specific recombinase XerD
MKVIFYKPTGKFRIIVPAELSGTGKRRRLFFDNKEDAIKEARKWEANRQAPRITKQQQAALVFAQQLGLPEHQILEAVKHYQKTVLSVVKGGATLQQACKDYLDHHKHEKSHAVTIRKYRSTLRRFSADLHGHALPIVEVTKDQILNVYLKRFGPGVTRMTQFSNLRAFFNWAFENQYIATNPLGETKALDKWESNKEILAPEDLERILFACKEKYPRLLPYFVLGGLAGLRRCEMISSAGVENDPRIEWSDIDFKLSKIRIRQEVAKETNADDRRRSIPLEPAAAEWLAFVAKSEGPVLEISQSTLQRDIKRLEDMLALDVPDNALRNSYASYGAAFRSIGDVARAMGDLEVTIKRYYVDLVDDPELGRAWFNIRPGMERKIVSMVAA